ncbi:MAG: 4Fe-4S dicluster domain-containing protein [Thermoplasmata archaeon]|nr:4Fe-4S dicluster domain-containing protein [Thermoplasmata archaeon]NIS10984.1 4Fe-4S dicluster domain-containing protein [Thermoplasmata archaeon]NIS18926.1 4Fe-4S dicluster domain-containing protein [Thermoplasmata archaeon]NIT75962.1 4Fe-4S dicluster domain-containing protein [Thermoplasmata archaeon]NIW81553.1 4Fe-4S dicluster domain-containing protein [Thermoplasmata archaeon]
MPEWHGETNDVTIKIDHDVCYGAEECVQICPANVYEINEDHKAMAENVDECIQCAACEGICPADAIWHSVWSD